MSGRITYEQAFADHAYLWEEYGPADDMTGGYVDQEDLSRLLKSPSKATARTCLIDQIAYWFQVGPDRGSGITRGRRDGSLFAGDKRLVEIAERYDQEMPA